jgi:hypothetical protein
MLVTVAQRHVRLIIQNNLFTHSFQGCGTWSNNLQVALQQMLLGRSLLSRNIIFLPKAHLLHEEKFA